MSCTTQPAASSRCIVWLLCPTWRKLSRVSAGALCLLFCTITLAA